jgi:hypothetical protein
MQLIGNTPNNLTYRVDIGRDTVDVSCFSSDEPVHFTRRGEAPLYADVAVRRGGGAWEEVHSFHDPARARLFALRLASLLSDGCDLDDILDALNLDRGDEAWPERPLTCTRRLRSSL